MNALQATAPFIRKPCSMLRPRVLEVAGAAAAQPPLSGTAAGRHSNLAFWLAPAAAGPPRPVLLCASRRTPAHCALAPPAAPAFGSGSGVAARQPRRGSGARLVVRAERDFYQILGVPRDAGEEQRFPSSVAVALLPSLACPPKGRQRS